MNCPHCKTEMFHRKDTHNNIYVCPVCGFTRVMPKCKKCEGDLKIKEVSSNGLKTLECKPCDITYYDKGNGIPITHEELFKRG